MPETDDAAQELLQWMERLSENCYRAGWMRDLEVDLWRLCHGENLGYGACRPEEISGVLERLHQLSGECGGWWTWSEADKDVRFVPIEEWHSRMGT